MSSSLLIVDIHFDFVDQGHQLCFPLLHQVMVFAPEVFLEQVVLRRRVACHILRLAHEHDDGVVVPHEGSVFLEFLLEVLLEQAILNHDHDVGLESLDSVHDTLTLLFSLRERVYESPTCKHTREDWIHVVLE